MAKAYIDLQEIADARALMAYVNSVPLEDVVFFKNGSTVDVLPGDIEEWRFVGMSNWAFGETMLPDASTH